jgi:8-oxo-dGTP pyrophosphatase MutT (NUDIX family)
MPEPAIPLPASTVVLLRPNAITGFDVYLNRRPDHLETYAGVFVFPGGRVEESDYSAAMLALTRGLTAYEAQQKLGVSLATEVCLGYWVAAVRELYEEVGIHFFVSDLESSHFSSNDIFQRMAERRPILQSGAISFAELLTAEHVYCDLSRLIYFFHRVTPEHYRVRFDTRFYVAALPADQTPLAVSEEVSESLWISPQLALERFAHNEFPMMPPTVMVLRALSKYRSWTELREVFGVC